LSFKFPKVEPFISNFFAFLEKSYLTRRKYPTIFRQPKITFFYKIDGRLNSYLAATTPHAIYYGLGYTLSLHAVHDQSINDEYPKVGLL